MKLVINKFPPITQKCEIDLSKKITLFVGKNNSGKTYLSQLIWGIYQLNTRDMLLGDRIQPINIMKSGDVPRLIKNRSITFPLSDQLIEDISQNYTQYLVNYRTKEIFKEELDVDFSISFNRRNIENIEHIYGDNYTIKYNKKDSNEITLNIAKTSMFDTNIEENDTIETHIKTMNKFFQFAILYSVFGYNSNYMPATRLFFPSFYKYIRANEKTLLDKVSNINASNKSFFAPSYTEPIDVLINKLTFELNHADKNRYLEKLSSIMEGNINIEKSEEISMAELSYTHKKSGKKLSMHMSSSMVNQLSMIYLYFQYWHKDKSFLLLDEPEINLHPRKKLEFIELLLDYASENKLVIATHSSMIAKSIINYIHLFDLKEKNIDLKTFIKENDLQINPNINLKSNDIAIYYFNGNTITSYKEDNESDIHFGTFTEIEKLQNKQYQYIMDKLEN